MKHPTDVDKYQVIKPLGSGHFGQVYHAFDRALQIEKAIKILKAKDPGKFLEDLKEGQILVRCRHKHIVSINEANVFGVEGESRIVLDLEYIPGGSLEGALRDRWVSIREAITYLRSALLGLEHAHSQGFLHRDIKPGNILLATTGAKLSDFGLATDAGSALYGSPRGYITHLPPEYFKGQGTSALTDLYATGITLFRTVSNIRDWRSVSSAVPNSRRHVENGTLIKQLGYDNFVPDVIRRIISKACHPDSTKRYQNAREFGQQLDKLRFGVDWVRTGDMEWRGFFETIKHEALVDESRRALVVMKNGRKVNSSCSTFTSLADAVSALNDHVAQSTLAQ